MLNEYSAVVGLKKANRNSFLLAFSVQTRGNLTLLKILKSGKIMYFMQLFQNFRKLLVIYLTPCCKSLHTNCRKISEKIFDRLKIFIYQVKSYFDYMIKLSKF